MKAWELFELLAHVEPNLDVLVLDVTNAQTPVARVVDAGVQRLFGKERLVLVIEHVKGDDE